MFRSVWSLCVLVVVLTELVVGLGQFRVHEAERLPMPSAFGDTWEVIGDPPMTEAEEKESVDWYAGYYCGYRLVWVLIRSND